MVQLPRAVCPFLLVFFNLKKERKKWTDTRFDCTTINCIPQSEPFNQMWKCDIAPVSEKMVTDCRHVKTEFQSSICCPDFSLTPSLPQLVKFPGWKVTHTHACKQYIWWSYNKSAFNTMHFDTNPFMCSCEGGGGGGGKALMISNLALLLIVFRATARQAWLWKG